jgi:serine phosphatase RsbU (regulator of sigma subunit)/pSer/pThr/pTyr-binding forkhead associated (FHA) protein
MVVLLTLKGPNAGRQFPLEGTTTVLGRQADAHICLESQAVSRHHARILHENGQFFVEDLHSSNGTFVNGQRIRERVALNQDDMLQIGPYSFVVRAGPKAGLTDTDLVIREQVSADPSHHTLLTDDVALKLQVVLEIAQHLGHTLDEETLLGKFLDHLMRLFPQTERSMVLLCHGDDMVVRAQRCRRPEDAGSFPYSRTVVRHCLNQGMGILSEDVHADERFVTSSTLTNLNLRSLLCVPLIGQNGRRLGVVQLDCFRIGKSFRMTDLQLLTAVALQAAVVLENAALHAELLHKERLRQELALAQEIQQGFLPTEFPLAQDDGFELFARVHSAREVSGDFYDFFSLPDGKLAFFVGDVSGKGIPAALYMVAVRTLSRHLAVSCQSPEETLRRLNPALAADNPSFMYVTLVHGIFDPATGEVVLASGGHPAPLVRHGNGRIDTVPVKNGRLLGFADMEPQSDPGYANYRFSLAPGDTLILYTDGFTEAKAPDRVTLFGLERLKETLGGTRALMTLEACIDEARNQVEQFTRTTELQDDLTLLLLRRMVPNAIRPNVSSDKSLDHGARPS